MHVLPSVRRLSALLAALLLVVATLVTFPLSAIAAGPSIDTQITASGPAGLSIKVTGTGFDNTEPGIYVALGDRFSATDASIYTKTAWIRGSQITDSGTLSTTLTLNAADIAKLDKTKSYSVYTFKAHGSPDRSQDAGQPVSIDFDSLTEAGTVPDRGPNPKPESGTSPSKGAGDSSSPGYLSWGVNASFRNYVTGPIANGSIQVGNGAKVSGGAYRFPQSSSNANEVNGIGSTSYRGTLLFSGHDGALSLNVASPKVTVVSGSSASLSMVVNGKRTPLVTLDIAKAHKVTSAGVITFQGAPARLTSTGAAAFSNFYSAGASMDPVTFAIGSDSSATGPGLTTVATSVKKAAWTAPPKPPTTGGLDLTFDDPDNVQAGQKVTAKASGFTANEESIKVVIYSTPVILEKNLKADAQGRATWTGLLPTSLDAGEHTLTFQGSVNRGATFIVKDKDTDSEFCKITDASFSWGVKESFRSYISGSIANGTWKTSGDASYKTPVFSFAGGNGGFDAATPEGEVDFSGGIGFSGHDGALKVTLADPTLKILDEKTAYLLFDTESGSMDSAMTGDESRVKTDGVPVVKLNLAKASLKTNSDGTTTATAVPTVLTSQGAEVFSNYDSGAAFDPIDFTIGNVTGCAGSDVKAPADASAATSVVTDPDEPSSLLWIALGLIAVVVVGGAVALARRVRKGVVV